MFWYLCVFLPLGLTSAGIYSSYNESYFVLLCLDNISLLGHRSMAEILLILPKTLSNQSNNQSWLWNMIWEHIHCQLFFRTDLLCNSCIMFIHCSTKFFLSREKVVYHSNNSLFFIPINLNKLIIKANASLFY